MSEWNKAALGAIGFAAMFFMLMWLVDWVLT